YNTATWSFRAGIPYTKELEDQIMKDLAQPYVQGLTLLGGEPFLNTGILLPLLQRIRRELPEKDIWSWTGYTWEEMMLETQDKLEMLSLIDILVDGRFDQSKRNLMLQFRGSSNQRIIDVQKSLKEGEVVIWEGLNDGDNSYEQVKRDDLL
ncbi:anaerobic ribonucleoside-triphosphate reductase activating protein, partial [Streptococcus agalactiae]|nr:anaerobic ribonucleoside-triphosphate reductase activating protein [Streptococcus agalactiae]